VLLYAEDARVPAKRVRARELVAELAAAGRMVISTQILQELFSAVTRKLGMSAAIARSLVEDYRKLDVVLERPALVLAAIDLHRLGSISFWDALVVKCASVSGCGRLLTEDLHHG
jgi:predicted nucleic acid-binding protein